MKRLLTASVHMTSVPLPAGFLVFVFSNEISTQYGLKERCNSILNCKTVFPCSYLLLIRLPAFHRYHTDSAITLTQRWLVSFHVTFCTPCSYTSPMALSLSELKETSLDVFSKSLSYRAVLCAHTGLMPRGNATTVLCYICR